MEPPFTGGVDVLRGVPDLELQGAIFGEPRFIGVAVPLGASLGGTGILRSSGEGGIICGGRSGIGMLDDSLL